MYQVCSTRKVCIIYAYCSHLHRTFRPHGTLLVVRKLERSVEMVSKSLIKKRKSGFIRTAIYQKGTGWREVMGKVLIYVSQPVVTIHTAVTLHPRHSLVCRYYQPPGGAACPTGAATCRQTPHSVTVGQVFTSFQRSPPPAPPPICLVLCLYPPLPPVTYLDVGRLGVAPRAVGHSTIPAGPRLHPSPPRL